MTTAAIHTKNLKTLVEDALQDIKDPEIPVISVVEMGMITKLEINGNHVEVTMTPTFAGCPAIHVIQKDIKERLLQIPGVAGVEVIVSYKTRWNSNRISEKGRKAIKEFGLAPPMKHQGEPDLSKLQEAQCPFCNSTNTTMNSAFGPTLCRATHYCYSCQQSFEQFKPL